METLKRAIGVVELLNDLAGRNFDTKEKSENIRLVLNLKKKGFSWEDIELMVKYKVWEWKEDVKMRMYLRPATLFGSKGSRYTAEAKELSSNEVLAKKAKESRDISLKKGNGGLVGGDITRDVVDRLKNW